MVGPERNAAPTKPRIGFLVTNLGGGGAERVAAEVGEHLKNYEVIFFVFDPERRYQTSRQVVVLDAPLTASVGKVRKAIDLLRAAWLVRRAKKEFRLDAMLSFMTVPNLLNVWTRRSATAYLSVHSTESVEFDATTAAKVFNAFARRGYRQSSGVIGVSQAVGEDIRDHFRVPEELVHVIYNPVWTSKIRDKMEEPLDPVLSEFLRGPTVVNLGRLVRAKGQWHLLRAFAAVKRDIPDAKLVLMGDGPLDGYLRDVATKLGLKVTGLPPDPEADVAFLGFLENPWSVLKEGTVFAFPSIIEGLGNALIEALACGVPSIAADCRSGPREILAPSLALHAPPVREPTPVEFGILMPPLDGEHRTHDQPLSHAEQMWADELRQALERPLAKYRAPGRKRGLEFDIQKIAADWDTMLSTHGLPRE